MASLHWRSIANYVFIVPFTAEYDPSGSHLGLFTGFNWYFLDFAGIHMNLAFYSRHAFDLRNTIT